MKSVIVLSMLLSVLAAAPALAQKKDRDATSTGIMEKQRQKEAEEWRVKGEKYMQEQEAAQKKRKGACSAVLAEVERRGIARARTRRANFIQIADGA